MADITLLNMNMLYVRYYDSVEKELHVPLGSLYLTRILEDAGYDVDFRDYQVNTYDDPFDADNICDYLSDSAELVGISVMANLLPFTLFALKRFKQRNPEKTIVLGGVGPKSVERTILQRFEWIDAIAYGEGERVIVPLVEAHKARQGFSSVPNMFWRDHDGAIIGNEEAERIQDLDTIPFPAWDRIDLKRYEGYGIMTSRGCPYPCTFCSVAPIWGHATTRRSDGNIIAEMAELKERAGADLFLFQDEFFVCTPKQVVGFCSELKHSKLNVDWKAFGRVNLTDGAMMQRMADSGCLELRFGIESGSANVLKQTKKGFNNEQAVDVISAAVKVFDRVDAFYVWGFPFETMEDFHQSVFQMVSFRLLGARILPSLLCFLPQTEIFRQYGGAGRNLEFCRELFPEYMLTGHEICKTAKVEIDDTHTPLFDFIEENPDIFPGFFHWDLQSNVLPKLRVLQEMGFYPADNMELDLTDSCGAHSPRVAQATSARAQLTVA
jgi:anaerobic magnesium-protoporphyrin IX monomethyl ester cyclase